MDTDVSEAFSVKGQTDPLLKSVNFRELQRVKMHQFVTDDTHKVNISVLTNLYMDLKRRSHKPLHGLKAAVTPHRRIV